MKLLDLIAELERQATREKRRLTPAQLPQLWILTPTASAAILADFGATVDLENWMSGVYFLLKGLKSAIMVIHQLPPTPETPMVADFREGEIPKTSLARTVPTTGR